MVLWFVTSALAGPIVLDFGPPSQVSGAPAHALTAEGLPEQDIVWVDPPKRGWAVGDLDPLLGDALLGGTLSLPLPEGSWNISIMQGPWPDHPWHRVAAAGVRANDQHHELWPAPVSWEAFMSSERHLATDRPTFLPGETAWHRQHQPTVPWKTFTYDSDGSAASFQFYGQPVYALVAWRDTAPDPRPGIDEARARWHAQRHATERSPRPVLGWAAIDGTRVDRPERVDLPAGGQAVRRLTPSLTDAPGSWHISTDAPVDVVMYEGIWRDRIHPTERTRARIELAELRPSPEGWLGAQWRPPAGVLWMNAHDDAQPGTYTVTVETLQGGKASSWTLEVEVHEVNDRALPPMGPFVQARPEAFLVEPAQVEPQLVRELEVLASLGFDAVGMRYLDWPTRAADRPDDTLAHAAVRAWHRLGGQRMVWSDPKDLIRYKAWHGSGLTPAMLDRLTDRLNALEDLPLRPVLHCWEEEGGSKGLAAIERARTVTRQWRGTTSLPLMATGGTVPDMSIARHFDTFLVSALWGNVSDTKRVRRTGTTPWSYNAAPGPAAGLSAWRLQTDAHLQWHLSPVSIDQGDFVERRSRWRHLSLGPDGTPWPTRWLLESAVARTDGRVFQALEDCPGHGPLPDHVRALLTETAGRHPTGAQMIRWRRQALAELRNCTTPRSAR